MTVALLMVVSPAYAETFTVNSTGDSVDAALDGDCNTSIFSTGVPECTLRAAIQESRFNNNQATVVDQIEFSIPGTGPHTISMARSMDGISEPVVIDGYTQPGSKKNTLNQPGKSNAVLKIQLRGPGNPFAEALSVGSGGSGSVIRGLAIGDFTTGILLYVGVATTGSRATSSARTPPARWFWATTKAWSSLTGPTTP
jgi:CSLREA domain-containing protein